MTTTTQSFILPTHQQLAAVDLATVPVMTTDRGIGRKNTAALARQLFRTLGVKGLSITAPNYSMAQAVHVGVPTENHEPADYLYEGEDYSNGTYFMMPEGVPAKMQMLRHEEAQALVKQILAVAFPNHDDRSDSQSDYFNYCWSIR